MSIDAVLLLRAKDASAASTLRGRGLHVRNLADGSMLVHSMMGLAGFQRDPSAAAAWLNALGDVAILQSDPRGVLIFPDTATPRGQTYDQVAAEVEAASFWLKTQPVGAPPEPARAAAVLSDVEALVLLARRMAAHPPPSPDELLKEDWPPVVREQLLHMKRMTDLVAGVSPPAPAGPPAPVPLSADEVRASFEKVRAKGPIDGLADRFRPTKK